MRSAVIVLAVIALSALPCAWDARPGETPPIVHALHPGHGALLWLVPMKASARAHSQLHVSAVFSQTDGV